MGSWWQSEAVACPDSQGSDAALQIESDQVNMSFHNIPAARQAQLTITLSLPPSLSLSLYLCLHTFLPLPPSLPPSILCMSVSGMATELLQAQMLINQVDRILFQPTNGKYH